MAKKRRMIGEENGERQITLSQRERERGGGGKEKDREKAGAGSFYDAS